MELKPDTFSPFLFLSSVKEREMERGGERTRIHMVLSLVLPYPDNPFNRWQN